MIVVVLPAYNEAEALPRLVSRVREVVASLGDQMTVVVVDDGSTDDTAAVAEQLTTPALPVQVVRHGANRGLHGALDTGLRAALALTGPSGWIVTMDADDTHPPDLIRSMIQHPAGASVVIASRFQPGAEIRGLTWNRSLFSNGVRYLFQIAWHLRGVRDYTCGYRVYRADILQRAYERWGDRFVSERSFACMPDVLWKVSRIGATFAEVPLSLHYDRKPGASKMNVRRTVWRTLVLIARRRFDHSGT
jgi:dolichol-phosphate mannosyltransferase